MAELKPMEVIMKIDFAASNGLEVVAHAKKVAELVRCQDCQHYNPEATEWRCDIVAGLVEPYDDDFCSYGERRTE